MWRAFDDRHQAGRLLAGKLSGHAGRPDTIVLGLPRGGVPVAFEVSRALDVPLDVFMVRKLGVPGHEEFAFGSVATGGTRFINEGVVKSLGMPRPMVDRVVESEERELERREKLYRGNRPPPPVRDKAVIVVDDGLATGSTMLAAVTAIRKLKPKEIKLAVPVCAPQTCAELEEQVDVWCTCVQAPEPFHAVGLWYRKFDQTTDDEVQYLLKKAESRAMNDRHHAWPLRKENVSR